jgi:hypothetical protein
LTYEDLILVLDEASPKLNGSALKLLLRIVALAIREGSPVVKVTQRSLAHDLLTARDMIQQATKAIAWLVPSESLDRKFTVYTIPEHWLPTERRLMFSTGGLETRPVLAWKTVHRASTFPQVALKPGHAMQENQATSGLETRPDWPGNQATLAGKPGQTGLETRPPETQNEQLADGSLNQIRSESDCSSYLYISQIHQISAIERLREDQKEVAALLAKDLMRYAQVHPPNGSHERHPPQLVLARCLALAPYETLLETLQNLHESGVRAGNKFSWFVTVFANRIHGFDATEVANALKRGKEEKKAEHAAAPLFADELTKQVVERGRKLA